MEIKVMIALSNALFSEGIKRLVEENGNALRAETLKTGVSPFKMAESFEPDVVMVDFTTLYNEFGDIGQGHGMKMILFDTNCGEVNIISAILTKGLKGVLVANSSPQTMAKAVKAVAEGEIWLDKVSLKNLLAGMNSLKKNTKPSLSAREWEIVSLVGQGFRNKEIAERLCISEPTVKTHLQHIFHKLDVSNRPQLITFAIRNRSRQDIIQS